MSIRARKAAGAPPLPPGNDRAEVEAMARRLEELRRAAGNSQLRAAYEAAIYGLDAVLYRLAMLRTLESPEPARRQVSATPATKAAAPTRAAAARIGATRKQRT